MKILKEKAGSSWKDNPAFYEKIAKNFLLNLYFSTLVKPLGEQ